MPISYRCTHCGRYVQVGLECECIQKIKDKKTVYKPSKKDTYSGAQKKSVYGSDSLYHSAAWKRLCDKVKERYSYMDIYAWYKYQRIETGEIVHHIIPVKDDYSKRFDINNLIYLTRKNHETIHQLYSSEKKTETQQELLSLIRRWNDDQRCGFSQQESRG